MLVVVMLAVVEVVTESRMLLVGLMS